MSPTGRGLRIDGYGVLRGSTNGWVGRIWIRMGLRQLLPADGRERCVPVDERRDRRPRAAGGRSLAACARGSRVRGDGRTNDRQMPGLLDGTWQHGRVVAAS